MWILFSLLSAASESIKDAFGKLGSTKTDEYTAAVSMHLFAFIATMPLVLWQGIPSISASFWWGTLGFLPITPLWSIAYMRALKLAPLSEVLPIMAFNPIFTAGLAYFFEGKSVPLLGWMGIWLIGIGIYMVYLRPNTLKRGILTPIKHIFSNRGSQYMFFVAFLWSVGAYLSKWRVIGSTPIFSTMSGALLGIITTAFLSWILHKPIRIGQFISHSKELLPIGVFYYLANISSSYALAFGPTPYVFSLKRGSIVLSALIGKLFYHETFFAAKLLGLFLMLLGILFLVL